MKVLINTEYLDGGRFLVRVVDAAPLPYPFRELEWKEATLGSVVKIRNKMIEDWTNRAEVSEVTANAIPFPAEYVK